ncbi:MAG TPA: AraC family transcriptional regulator, partial [Spirochaetota bacterium]|nr:AraC family transcriptional regulator [Spirochaetota bacterium]
RVWTSVTGETLSATIQRLRLEKSADLLLKYPDRSILEIALECGFSGQAVFARSFKDAYGMSASAWRQGGAKVWVSDKGSTRRPLRKDCKTHGKECKGSSGGNTYPHDVQATTGQSGQQPAETISWSDAMTAIKQAEEVRVSDDPAMTLAYVRHVGPYAGDGELFGRLFGRLCAWAGPRGFLGPDATMLTIYHDNPEIVDDEKLRISVCCSVPEGTKPDGDIGIMEMAAGRNVHARFELSTDEFGSAWNWLFSKWLPESGYQPDDRPCYEHYLNDPSTHPEGKHLVEIVTSIKPL